MHGMITRPSGACCNSRLARYGRRPCSIASTNRCTGTNRKVRILAITPNAGDWGALHQVADQCGWMLFWAQSRDSALDMLSQYSIPIVICDRDLPGEDWRSVLKQISIFGQPVCVLLASSVSDEYLWREVVQHQGFDVLSKPFQADRLIRTVNLVRSWRGWMDGRSVDKPTRSSQRLLLRLTFYRTPYRISIEAMPTTSRVARNPGPADPEGAGAHAAAWLGHLTVSDRSRRTLST